MNLCPIDNCEREVKVRGLCQTHYQRARRSGTLPNIQAPPNLPCSVEGCERKNSAKGLCKMHYMRKRSGVPLDWVKPTPQRLLECSVDGCKRKCATNNMCKVHWLRWTNYGRLELVRDVERDPVCTIEGCERGHVALGLCRIHYNRKRTGIMAEDGSVLRQDQFEHMVEDCMELLSFGVTHIDELWERAGFVSRDSMRKHLTKEQWEKVKMQCLS